MMCMHELMCLIYIHLNYSLLREHTLDGSGWAPTRKLKVGFFVTTVAVKAEYKVGGAEGCHGP